MHTIELSEEQRECLLDLAIRRENCLLRRLPGRQHVVLEELTAEVRARLAIVGSCIDLLAEGATP